MSQSQERLYNLLPAIYRQRDVERGEPLRALLAVMEQELEAIEEDITGLYEDWFIETCNPWVVPYMADLLGISSLGDEKNLVFSQRSYVANTIAYRRRKGIAAVIENVAFDVTGWRARAVEFFEKVGITQHIQHVRSGKGATIDLRDRAAMERLGSPFDHISRQVDVHQIASKSSLRGKHSPLNLGLFVWRLQSYPITRSPAGLISSGCYTFHPLGQDIPLFNYPQTKTEFAQISDEVNLPIPIGRQVFETDLNAQNSQPQNSRYYGRDRAFCIFQNGELVLLNRILSQDLSNWQRPDAGKVAVDVNLGRFAFATGEEPAQGVEVNYAYGFSADMGGGPYYRAQTVVENATTWQTTVGSSGTFPTLQAALAEWQNISQFINKGIIRIIDNGVYDLSQPIALPASSQLVIEAIDGVKPSLQSAGDITIHHQGQLSTLTLDGLVLISKQNDTNGQLRIPDHIALTLRHCTLIAGLGALIGQGGLANAQVTIAYSIVGPIRLPAQMRELTIQDSIVDARLVNLSRQGMLSSGAVAIAGSSFDQPGPTTTLERTTIFGAVNLSTLALASNVVFTDAVTVQRQQTGSIRYSYVPGASKTPQRYRCQPDLATNSSSHSTDKLYDQQRLIPRFTSTCYGDPGYAQLSLQCAPEIGAGGDDGSEMGAFYGLHQPQRSAYLELSLEEYVPVGLEAGIFYVT